MLAILVVEDAPNVRDRVVDFFTRRLSGYTLYPADNREDAMSAILQHEPDLLLLDLAIPPPPPRLSLCGQEVCFPAGRPAAAQFLPGGPAGQPADRRVDDRQHGHGAV
jgi:CheY-like chemotaxis protein